MLLHIASEERGIGESQECTDLLDAQVGLHEVIPDVLEHIFTYPLVGRLARVVLADGGEIFGRDAQLVGIISNPRAAEGTTRC